MYGIDAHLIDVEVDIYQSCSPADFVLVGMPDVAARESRERIQRRAERGSAETELRAEMLCGVVVRDELQPGRAAGLPGRAVVV